MGLKARGHRSFEKIEMSDVLIGTKAGEELQQIVKEIERRKSANPANSSNYYSSSTGLNFTPTRDARSTRAVEMMIIMIPRADS